jgi:hypothetical protein
MFCVAVLLLLFAISIMCTVARNSGASYISSPLKQNSSLMGIIKEKWEKARVLAELEQLVEGERLSICL